LLTNRFLNFVKIVKDNVSLILYTTVWGLVFEDLLEFVEIFFQFFYPYLESVKSHSIPNIFKYKYTV